MKKHFILSLILSTFLCASSEVDALFDLSLEELMNMEITTATGEKETTSESISIVSVLSSTQLKQMGALNLYEAIGFLPGIQINETYMGYTTITFRGVTQGLFNNKVLFMVNGHPVHEKIFGSSYLEYVPLDMIDRVEVVRSPASVLYGTNAISGVINIITKQGVDLKNEVALRAGSNGHYFGSLSMHDTYVSMGVSYQNDDGYDFNGATDELGQTIDKDYQNDIGSLFVDIYGDDWRINTAMYSSKKEKLGINPIVQQGGINKFESLYVDLNKEFSIGSGTLNTWLRYDHTNRSLDFEKFPNPVTDNAISAENEIRRYSAEIQYKDVILDDIHYVVGLSYEHDDTDPFLFIDQINDSIHPFSPITQKHHTDVYALYSQVKYRINDSLTSIVGFRLGDNSDTGTAFVPRLGLNYEFSSNKYLKFLYSQAYRSPVFVEKYTNVPGVLVGDENLDREKIQTFEISLDAKLGSKSSLETTIYYLELDNEITRRPSVSGATEYYNADGYYMYGLEMAYSIILNENSEISLNSSYTTGKHENNEDVKFIANFTANMMFTYKFDNGISTTVSNQYVGSKDYYTSSGDMGNIDNYNLANITATYKKMPFEYNLYIKNIFDEDYTYPEPVRKNIKEIPGGAGSSIYLTLRYYF